MKFCTKCGKEVKEEQTFCTHCGNDLKNKSTNKTQPIDETNSTEEFEPVKETNLDEEHISNNNKSSKKMKIVIAVIIGLIIAIFTIIQVGNSLSDPKKLETRFQNDIASNNNSDLASILYCNDDRLTVDSKNIVPLLDSSKSKKIHKRLEKLRMSNIDC